MYSYKNRTNFEKFRHDCLSYFLANKTYTCFDVENIMMFVYFTICDSYTFIMDIVKLKVVTCQKFKNIIFILWRLKIERYNVSVFIIVS